MGRYEEYSLLQLHRLHHLTGEVGLDWRLFSVFLKNILPVKQRYNLLHFYEIATN